MQKIYPPLHFTLLNLQPEQCKVFVESSGNIADQKPTVLAKRTFSTLRRLKTWQDTLMVEEVWLYMGC